MVIYSQIFSNLYDFTSPAILNSLLAGELFWPIAMLFNVMPLQSEHMNMLRLFQLSNVVPCIPLAVYTYFPSTVFLLSVVMFNSASVSPNIAIPLVFWFSVLFSK